VREAAFGAVAVPIKNIAGREICARCAHTAAHGAKRDRIEHPVMLCGIPAGRNPSWLTKREEVACPKGQDAHV
jgi:hypothetical protein